VAHPYVSGHKPNRYSGRSRVKSAGCNIALERNFPLPPSRMRILLDSKDLINLIEHSKPLSVPEFNDWLGRKHGTLVYSMQNIRGITGPIGMNALHVARIRRYLDDLEQLPHCFIRADIDSGELESAARCFIADREFETINPYVSRFDQVLPSFAGYGRPTYRLRDTVSDLWKKHPILFQTRPDLQAMFGLGLSISRTRPPKFLIASEPALLASIADSLQSQHGLDSTTANDVARWIEADASRCPGLRFIQALGVAMSNNTTYAARRDDMFDMSQLLALPYVEAATVDRTMLDYVSRARNVTRRVKGDLTTLPPTFRDLQTLLNFCDRA